MPIQARLLKPEVKLEEIKVRPGTKRNLIKRARAKKLKVWEYIEYLMEFEDMQHIDEIARGLRQVDSLGFSLKQLVHLSVLFSLMKQLDRDYYL